MRVSIWLLSSMNRRALYHLGGNGFTKLMHIVLLGTPEDRGNQAGKAREPYAINRAGGIATELGLGALHIQR